MKSSKLPDVSGTSMKSSKSEDGGAVRNLDIVAARRKSSKLVEVDGAKLKYGAEVKFNGLEDDGLIIRMSSSVGDIVRLSLLPKCPLQEQNRFYTY